MMAWGSGDGYSWNPHLNISAGQGFRRRFVENLMKELKVVWEGPLSVKPSPSEGALPF